MGNKVKEEQKMREISSYIVAAVWLYVEVYAGLYEEKSKNTCTYAESKNT